MNFDLQQFLDAMRNAGEQKFVDLTWYLFDWQPDEIELPSASIDITSMEANGENDGNGRIGIDLQISVYLAVENNNAAKMLVRTKALEILRWFEGQQFGNELVNPIKPLNAAPASMTTDRDQFEIWEIELFASARVGEAFWDDPEIGEVHISQSPEIGAANVDSYRNLNDE